MGWDTVSFSLKNTYQDNTLYNTWLNRVKNGNTKEFKEYLLSSDENLQLFAKHFDNYQEGDMFVKESVVELADGRLLCFDADQAQAYIIDFENIDKSRDTICMNVIKPNDSSASYDKQIENIVKQIKAHIGEDKFKTKDGTKLDSEYITTNLLQSTSLSLYQEAKGITTDSETGETTTSIDTKNLNKIYYKSLNQITSDDEEKEYYQTLLQSLGVSIDNDENIVDGTEVIQEINNIINQISKNLNPTTLTLANQNRLNLLELVRKLSLSEITLIEKLNPGLLSTIGEFIGTYQGVTYTDKYGYSSSTSETVTWADIMKEKADMQDDPLAYLRYEDRTETKVNGNTLKCVIDGKEYTTDELKEDKYYSITASNGITYVFNQDGKLIRAEGVKADAANKLATNQVDMAKTAIEVSSYIENTQAQGVSDTTIEAYLDDFKKYFSDDWGKDNLTCTNPDEALIFLSELRNPEVAFKLLQDSNVQKAIKVVSKAKGTLAGGKGQTPEMYYIGDDGKVGTDANGNLLTKKMDLTVSNVAMHLNILTELYKSSKYDENGNYIAGDQERIADGNALSSIEKLLSGLTEGENVEATSNMGAETVTAVSTAAGAAALSGTGIAISNHLGGYTLKGGIEKVTQTVTRKTLLKGGKTMKISKTCTLTSSKIATGLGVAGVIAGGVAGGFTGAAIADGIIQGSPNDFTDENGNFMKDKANTFKGFSVTSGAGVGAGAAALLTFGLSNPVGWACLGIGAVAGLVAWGIKSWWK